MFMSKQRRSDNNEDKQALEETKMVADLAPDAKTREAQGVIETIRREHTTVQEQEQQIIENNLSETKKIITKTAK